MTIDLSLLITVVGLVVSIVSAVLTVFLYFKNKSKTLLEYQVTSTRLITKDVVDIPNLQISIGGEPASDLVATTVVFTNVGNTTIHSSNIASKAPIQLTSSGHFFNANEINEGCIKSNNEYLNQSVSVVEDSKITIGFEYLKPKQTFSITVFHDGQVSVSGKLKSGLLRQYGSNSDVLAIHEAGPSSFFFSVFFPILLLAILVVCIFILSFPRAETIFEPDGSHPIISFSADDIFPPDVALDLSDIESMDSDRLVECYLRLSEFYLKAARSASNKSD